MQTFCKMTAALKEAYGARRVAESVEGHLPLSLRAGSSFQVLVFIGLREFNQSPSSSSGVVEAGTRDRRHGFSEVGRP